MKTLFHLILLSGFLTFTSGKTMKDKTERVILIETIIDADIDLVYHTWTTKEGLQTFFAPECEVELKLFGPFHIHFFPENPVGSKGAEDEIVISFEKNKMISFTWGFPPSLMDLRNNQKTIVMVRFEDLVNNKTKVSFTHSGWGEGEEWDKGYEYFEKAWKEVVFKRFIERFDKGPIDWTKK